MVNEPAEAVSYIEYQPKMQDEVITVRDNQEMQDSIHAPVLNPLLLNSINAKLALFEKEKGFITKGITLADLASYCGTNTSYLSKIINSEKGKSFSQYINDLRLEYVIMLWKSNPKTRYLSIQQIAGKAGFTTAQNFSKNFQERYKIRPTYFLRKLNEDIEKLQES